MSSARDLPKGNREATSSSKRCTHSKYQNHQDTSEAHGFYGQHRARQKGQNIAMEDQSKGNAMGINHKYEPRN